MLTDALWTYIAREKIGTTPVFVPRNIFFPCDDPAIASVLFGRIFWKVIQAKLFITLRESFGRKFLFVQVIRPAYVTGTPACVD